MILHLYQDRDTYVFALTNDRTGGNLPTKEDTRWVFRETLDPVQLAWGEDHFKQVYDAIEAEGFFIFVGQFLPRH